MSIILIADKSGNPIGGVEVKSKRSVRANARSLLADRLALGRYGTSFGGDRDYYEILGYPPDPDIDDYLARFDRDPLGGRIVEFPAEETWRDTPTIRDGADKEAKEDTPFCQAWTAFAEKLRVYHYCQRVDTLAGIGRFGVLVIGLAGNGNLSQPVKFPRGAGSVIYLRPYGEQSVKVKEFETDPGNERFGLPRLYAIETADVAEAATSGKQTTRQIEVHWSRVIHVAEGLLENEVYGRPRLQRVINLLDDILKVVGGSAEATWKLMRKGFALTADDLEAEFTEQDKEAVQTQFDEYDHGLRRFMLLRGLTPHDLGSEVVDPKGIFDVIVTLVSIATRIPKRILTGSERGELASSQDASTWAGYIASRQLNFAEPMILRPLIDRLVRWGVIPAPQSGRYVVAWDALFELTDIEKADIANKWADAAKKAKEAVGHPVLTAEEYRAEFTPFPGELPDELAQARARAQQAAIPATPDGEKDVLEQVADVLENHGYGGEIKSAILGTAKQLIGYGGKKPVSVNGNGVRRVERR